MSQEPTSQEQSPSLAQPPSSPAPTPSPSGPPPKKSLSKGVKIALVVFAVLVLISGLSTCGKGSDTTTKPEASHEVSTPRSSSSTSSEPQSESVKKEPAKPAAPEKTEEELAAEAAAKAKLEATHRSGTYKVGSEIPAGQYYLEGSGYFAIMSDSSGTLDAIIANDNYSGNSIVDLVDGQYFQLKGPSMYPIEFAKPLNATELRDGMYRVGVDMPAGEYKITSASGMGYIEVTSDASHTLNGIITNEIIEDSFYQTVNDGQYIKLSGVTATLV